MKAIEVVDGRWYLTVTLVRPNGKRATARRSFDREAVDNGAGELNNLAHCALLAASRVREASA